MNNDDDIMDGKEGVPQEVMELDNEPSVKLTNGIDKLLSDMYSKVCNTKLASNSRSRIKDEIERYKIEPSPHVDVNPLD